MLCSKIKSMARKNRINSKKNTTGKKIHILYPCGNTRIWKFLQTVQLDNKDYVYIKEFQEL